MKYISSLSGGRLSAIATDRAIQRYGAENVTRWFADTSWEDPDLYRFLADLDRRWGRETIVYRDGRTPLDVSRSQNMIPNSRVAPCTHRLKIEPFVKYLETVEKPVTVLLGLDWSEVHRMDAPKARYEAVEGVFVDFPMMWKPYEFRQHNEILQEWGIEPPALYEMGFPHNNCGGRCVKQGKREWLRLLRYRPDDYAAVEQWENEMRARGEPWSNYAICSDEIRRNGERVKIALTLSELRKRNEPIDGEPSQEDLFSCFCSY
jgi:3'-phosphoadenosine 5'-phosphosulfate sulfotransferase (PAPS reductase)/FAD synthetase